MTSSGLAFVKGHGTENDFVLIPDREGVLEFTAAQVRSICDRRAGIGGDGLIRVAPADGGGYFMDYRNADGSVAEMCGNGARVFARYLVSLGWEKAGRFEFLTRGGRRIADVGETGQVSIGMGPVRLGPSSEAMLNGRKFPGLSVDVGNPHLVCAIDADPATLDLDRAPEFDSAVFPHGVNVEFTRPNSAGELAMRVYERGVGETRSCGTGTVAAAAAQLYAAGQSQGSVKVRVPGGLVTVALTPQPSDHPGFGGATLTGPAVLVACGTIDPALLA